MFLHIIMVHGETNYISRLKLGNKVGYHRILTRRIFAYFHNSRVTFVDFFITVFPSFFVMFIAQHAEMSQRSGMVAAIRAKSSPMPTRMMLNSLVLGYHGIGSQQVCFFR